MFLVVGIKASKSSLRAIRLAPMVQEENSHSEWTVALLKTADCKVFEGLNNVAKVDANLLSRAQSESRHESFTRGKKRLLKCN